MPCQVNKGIQVRLIPKCLTDARGFLQIGLVFWYFLPLYVLALISLIWVVFVPIGKHNDISFISILWIFGVYSGLGYLVSGIIVYRTIRDKFRIPMLLRLFLSFIIVFYGGMIVSEPYRVLVGVPFSELMDFARSWVDDSAAGGNVIEASIKAALVLSGLYVAISLMFSFIPSCVILVSTLIGKSGN
jgi:hypothetical protein